MNEIVKLMASNIKLENKVPGLKVVITEDNDGEISIALTRERNQGRKISEFFPGDIVKIGDREYVVLEHLEEYTAVMTVDVVSKRVFSTLDGDYIKSDVKNYLNTEFYTELAGVVGHQNILRHTVNLLAEDGTNKGKKTNSYISLLTSDQYRRYREYIPDLNEWWWLATPVSCKTSPRCVCCVLGDGSLDWNGCVYRCGVRPFCILKSSVLVDA